jgi:hypothetical protein
VAGRREKQRAENVPRCPGAVSLLQKPLHYKGVSEKFVNGLCVVGLGPIIAHARVWFTRYLIVSSLV